MMILKGKLQLKLPLICRSKKKNFQKNLILFPLRHFCTMNHEGLHGFNVKHTHRNSSPLDKYVFPNTD